MADSGGRRGQAVFGVALLLGLLVVAWAAGRPPTDGEPLDPRSSGELGTRGLVVFLGELGAEVDLTRAGPPETADVALILEDRLTDDVRDDVAAWAGRGGTLVVADPGSPLSALVADDAGNLLEQIDGDLERGDCDIDALDDVNDVDAPGALLYEVPDDGSSCFGDDAAAYVVSAPFDAGTVISIGSPSPFINDDLDERDHAVLAAALLVPGPDTRITVLERPLLGDGDESLSDLVADGVKAALIQLAIAFLVYALFRARRLGRPVAEPLPVQIAGSELVGAVGELMQQSRDPGRAAGIIQDDTRRLLARRLGLPVTADAEAVADAVTARGGPSREHVLELLASASVSDERELVDLARSLDAIRQEILHVQSV